MNVAVVGATSGLGASIAEAAAKRGWSLILAARGEKDLSAMQADLELRFNVPVKTLVFDLATIDPNTTARSLCADTDELDAFILIAGATDASDVGQIPQSNLDSLMRLNCIKPIALMNELIPAFRRCNTSVVIAGSVAAIRARRKNMIYSSAKRALEFYSEGLRHELQSSCSVCCYRIGFIDSSLTYGQKNLLPSARPAKLADVIISKLGKHRGVRYLPRWWFCIALTLNALPWPIYKRLRF